MFSALCAPPPPALFFVVPLAVCLFCSCFVDASVVCFPPVACCCFVECDELLLLLANAGGVCDVDGATGFCGGESDSSENGFRDATVAIFFFFVWCCVSV